MTDLQFFTVSPNVSELSNHLDDLARKYPSQPVDRSLLKFCEAVAKWRGKPELETVSFSSFRRILGRLLITLFFTPISTRTVHSTPRLPQRQQEAQVSPRPQRPTCRSTSSSTLNLRRHLSSSDTSSCLPKPNERLLLLAGGVQRAAASLPRWVTDGTP